MPSENTPSLSLPALLTGVAASSAGLASWAPGGDSWVLLASGMSSGSILSGSNVQTLVGFISYISASMLFIVDELCADLVPNFFVKKGAQLRAYTHPFEGHSCLVALQIILNQDKLHHHAVYCGSCLVP